MVLANNRYLWRFLFYVVNKRKMDAIIPNALRKITKKTKNSVTAKLKKTAQ